MRDVFTVLTSLCQFITWSYFANRKTTAVVPYSL